MKKKQILQATRRHVRGLLSGEPTGHDWWHIERVTRLSKRIAQKEGGDLFVIELAALLHDIADWKFHGGDETVGAKKAREWLQKLQIDEATISDVESIIQNISYKATTKASKMKTKEGIIVQDADRLDAIGATGIARAFAFGGHVGIEIYNPAIKPKKFESFKDLKKIINKTTTINHFYEKLLLLKDKMNTKTGKKLAKERHKFMEQYLKQFYKESQEAKAPT
ncbi:HD domain-containing protein [Candidatus Roizmanbacteria bacterium]|nr:HD domain-containing protein [Candidatus Roizmanbacteria bacterium]